MDNAVLVVGCGNMGYAMVKGWVDQSAIAADAITVVEPNEALRERAAKLGTHVAPSADGLEADDFLLAMIAVKPQMLNEVLPAYRRFAEAGTTILTVAAGAPIATYRAMLGEKAAIIRAMPNTPAAVGMGMIATVNSADVPAEADVFAHHLLNANGVVERLENEALMDAVTAVSGSGPAYLFHFIECLTDAAREAGLPETVAATFARQTVFGAAALARESTEDAAQLRRNVTSPNGTTAAALNVLMGDDALKTLLTKAVLASRDRSIELAKV